jgi:hypothetical protein
MRIKPILKAGCIVLVAGAFVWLVMPGRNTRTPQQEAKLIADEAERTCRPLRAPDLSDPCWRYFERRLIASVPALREAERKAIGDILIREVCPHFGPHAERCAAGFRQR